MFGVVADTHAVLWFLARSPRISATAFNCLQATLDRGHPVFVPTICLVETTYLVEKGRLPGLALGKINEHLGLSGAGFELTPLDQGVAHAVARISRSQVPDMPDRIIAATALHLRLPLVSRDGNIRALGIETVW